MEAEARQLESATVALVCGHLVAASTSDEGPKKSGKSGGKRQRAGPVAQRVFTEYLAPLVPALVLRKLWASFEREDRANLGEKQA
eukprot:3926222-Pleurochrysis_carterae.AAC.1